MKPARSDSGTNVVFVDHTSSSADAGLVTTSAHPTGAPLPVVVRPAIVQVAAVRVKRP